MIPRKKNINLLVKIQKIFTNNLYNYLKISILD